MRVCACALGVGWGCARRQNNGASSCAGSPRCWTPAASPAHLTPRLVLAVPNPCPDSCHSTHTPHAGWQLAALFATPEVLASVAQLEQHAVCERLARQGGAGGAERDRHAVLARQRQDAAHLLLAVDLQGYVGGDGWGCSLGGWCSAWGQRGVGSRQRRRRGAPGPAPHWVLTGVAAGPSVWCVFHNAPVPSHDRGAVAQGCGAPQLAQLARPRGVSTLTLTTSLGLRR